MTIDVEQGALTIRPGLSAWEIADELDAASVGCAVVVDEDGAAIGIVTDRDLLCRVIAPGLDPDKTTAEDIMTRDPVTAPRFASIDELVEKMQAHKVRRIPIVEDGAVVFLQSLDDIVLDAAARLTMVSESVRQELRESRRTVTQRRRGEQTEELVEMVRSQLTRSSERARGVLVGELERWIDRLGGRKD